jgi:hypothetical protein
MVYLDAKAREPPQSARSTDTPSGKADRIIAPEHLRPFGVYSGHFIDPHGHLGEIALNSNE